MDSFKKGILGGFIAVFVLTLGVLAFSTMTKAVNTDNKTAGTPALNQGCGCGGQNNVNGCNGDCKGKCGGGGSCGGFVDENKNGICDRKE